jgi:hypothetical protein
MTKTQMKVITSLQLLSSRRLPSSDETTRLKAMCSPNPALSG